MKHLLTNPSVVLGGFLIGLVIDSSAMTLGRARGVALIGRPLDIAIQATLDADSDAANLCLQAEIFQGDFRMSDARITTQLEPGAGSEAVVRVRSSAVVEEPVLTMYLRVGCNQAVTRRYVLLAEPANDATTPVTLPSTGLAPQSEEPASRVARPSASRAPEAPRPPVRSVDSASASEATPSSGRRSAARPRPSDSAEVARGTTTLRAQQTLQAARRAPPKPRLKLDPLDLSLDSEPNLKASVAISVVPAATSEQRANAAALWKALNAGPNDAMLNARRVEALEADMKLIREQLQLNNASLRDLRVQLEKAEAERFSNGLVYALLALLVLSVAALIYRWRSRPEEPDWWHDRPTEQDEAFGSALPPQKTNWAEHVDSSVDVDLDSEVDSEGEKTPPPRSKRPLLEDAFAEAQSRWPKALQSDFQASQPGSMRSVKAEELNDVQQQADFFISLGEYEQAINVLMTHIHANPQTSALAWLDLLDLQYRLQRREGYEALRKKFQQRFNVQVPAFDAYSDHSEGLEAYGQALERIAALWPSPRVLDVIEDSIFRKPGDRGAEPFDLTAYRELLLLYNIGREVIHGEEEFEDVFSAPDAMPPSSGFSSTSIDPLSPVLEPRESQPQDLMPVREPWSESSELDIDLDVLADEEASARLAAANPPARNQADDSHLVHFDPFDEATARIKPRRGH